MSSVKFPRTIRLSQHPASVSAGPIFAVGKAAAACIGVLVAGQDMLEQGAVAQERLPGLTVEAQAVPKRRKAAKPKPTTNKPGIEGESGGSGGTAASAGNDGAGTGKAADANPYADPKAPYKIDRSASSKLPQSLLDTPRTVDVIPKEVIEDKGATTLRELVRTTPGLTLGTGEGGNAFGDRVFIRGFDARNDMYINGIREPGVTTRETFMTEQVEVIKGPSGTIGGRGSAGGSVNIITKQATTESFQDIGATLGTDLTRRLTADVNQKLNDNLSVRVNGLVHQSDVAGRDHVYDNRYGGSVAALWKPTETFRATFDYYTVYMNGMPDWGVPFDARIRRPFTESGLNRSNFYGVTTRDFQDNFQHLATQGLEWKLAPDLTLTNKLRYGYTVSDYVASKPGTPNLSNIDPALWTVTSSPASRYQVNQTVANQTEMTARFDLGPFRHTAVSGVELQREGISQDSYSGLTVECNPVCSSGITTNLWNPTAWQLQALGHPMLGDKPTKTNVDTISAYALHTLNWNDQLLLNLGVRADSYTIERTPFGSAALSRDDLLPNWNAGLTYKPTPSTSLYVAYATSSNPVGSELDGTTNDYGGLTLQNSVFRPEENTALEAGAKWEAIDHHVLLTAALFQTTKDNARETVGTGVSAVLQDTAAYQIRGVEFGATGNITERWSVFAGAVFMDSEVTESAIPQTLSRPLANIAHNSFNLLTKYQITNDLTVGGQVTWKGEILGGTLAATYFPAGTINIIGATTATPAGYNKLPSGARVDLFAEYKLSKNLTAKLQVLNVFDETLYDAFYRSGTPFVYVAPGRAGYLNIQAKF